MQPLTELLTDDEYKTRANAAGALGNLVRNSGMLCTPIVQARALQASPSCCCPASAQCEHRQAQNVSGTLTVRRLECCTVMVCIIRAWSGLYCDLVRVQSPTSISL